MTKEQLDQLEQEVTENESAYIGIMKEAAVDLIAAAREALRLGTQLTDALKLQSKLKGDVRDYREEVEQLAAEVKRLQAVVSKYPADVAGTD